MQKSIYDHLKLLTVFLLILCFATNLYAQKQKVWIDADTGNETDDIYALVRLLDESSIEVIGLSSAHFNNADLVAFEKWNQYNTKGINTVRVSQQLNEEALRVMGKSYIPHPLGADRQMGRAWGGREPRDSKAAQGIIAAVKKLDKGTKLSVICLGALTNIASAISIDTSIAQHLVCYALGAKYNTEKGYWNKSEFNIRNDLNAFDYLLDNESVDITVMPTDVAYPFKFERDSLYAILKDDVPVLRMLKTRWEETNPQDTIRTLWDLALAEAFVNPELVIIKQVTTPPENTQRMVKIFTEINVDKFKADFIQKINNETTYHP